MFDSAVMPLTITAWLRGDKQRRRWTYREAMGHFDVSDEQLRRWVTGANIPERWRAAQLADFLDTTEPEILAAMDEAERERRDHRELQDQVDAMRQTQRTYNERIGRLEEQLQAILDVLRGRTGDGDSR